MSCVPIERPCPCIFGHKALIAFLAFLNAFGPLSTDLYLPALPQLSVIFNAPVEVINLTLSGYMLFYALSTLIWGPLSDRFGRKPILWAGLGLYTAASFFCIVSPTIYLFILGRLLQAVGVGAAISVSMAIVKDSFAGRTMGSVLAWLQTITMIAPMVAPVLGAFLLTFLSWRGLFYVLAFGGIVALIASCSLRETLPVKNEGSVFKTLGRLGFVLKNKGFCSLLLLFSVLSMPFMAFLASSSYIYIDFFELSAQQYSYFFVFNAVMCMLAPLMYMRFFRDMQPFRFMAVFTILVACAGILLFFFGHVSPFAFAILFAPVTFCCLSLRPFGVVLMMHQQDTDNGTVSALILCTAMLFGSLSMFLCSLPWLDFISRCAIIATVVSLLALVFWVLFNRIGIFRPLSDISGANVDK